MTRDRAIIEAAESVKEQGSVYIPGVGIITREDIERVKARAEKKAKATDKGEK